MVWKLVLPILVGIELAITDRQITWGIIIVRVKTHGNTNTRKNMQNKSGLQLVSGLEHEFYDFPYIGNFIIPTDELHHCSEGPVNHHWRSPSLFRGVAIPPTRQWWTPKAIAVQLRSAMEGSFDPISVCLITWFPYGFVWKSSIPPTNPNAHTYVNGDDVETHGNAVMQSTFLKQFIYTVLYI